MVEIEGIKVKFESSFIEDMVSRHNINFSSNNLEIKNFLLEFSPLLEQNGYNPIRKDIQVVIADEDVEIPDRQGYCISDKDFAIIIIYRGHFQKEYKENDDNFLYKRSLVKTFIICLLHELAHNVVFETFGEDEEYESHGGQWRKCAKVLGLEDFYINNTWDR